MTDEPDDCVRDQRLRDLAAHLEATAEYPIDHRTNRWLGEAEAVATDVATGDLDEETVRTRIRQIQHLLTEAGETGHEAADDRLEAAHRLCREVLDE